jgi:Cdc6-like AAA superfamily ATPase
MADLDFIIINGMELRHPSDAYTRLWEEVSPDKERCQANTAGAKLEKYFAVAPSRGKDRGMGRNMGSGERGHVIVLLVDELDYLVTKKSGLVYELLFDWPSRSLHRRRLVVIGISNTINLLERLHERFESRIGCKTCFFESYKHEQIYRIVQAKVAQASPDYEVFDENAITFVSKKTAALSGDVRKAFRQCRAAAEMVLANLECGAEENQGASPRVSIKDVLQVDRDSFNSARTKSVTLCSPFEALFLVALASLCKWTGREHGSFDVEEILTKMNAMAKSLGDSRYLPPPTLDETLLLVSRLGEAHLIDLSTPRNSSASHRPGVSGSGGPWPFVKMVLDDTAILVALTKTDNRELAQKFLKQWPGSHTI